MTRVDKDGISVYVVAKDTITIVNRLKDQCLELSLEQMDTVVNALKVHGLYVLLLRDPLGPARLAGDNCPRCKSEDRSN